MKIALVSEHASPLAVLGGVDAGGQNVHVAALAAGLAQRGHDVTVFTRCDSTTLPATVHAEAGYRIEHVPAGPPTDIPKDELLRYMPDFADHLGGRLAEERFDVVHAHFWMSGLASVAAAQRLGIRVVQTFHALGSVKRRHQGDKDTSPPARIEMESRLSRSVDRVIATCQDEVRELCRLGMPPGNATVVPCGVDVRSFTPSEREPDGRRLLSVGRLVERKGIGNVIVALMALPGARLVIAGGPAKEALEADPEFGRLWAIAEEHGVTDRVTFLGAVAQQDVPSLMRDSDIVVCAPWYEPFGIVPLEAMACGRPVVGTAVGGLLDTIEENVTGELVPPRDPDRLAEVLGDLLDDPARRAAYGRAGRRRVLEHYTWERVSEATEAVYERVTIPLVSPAGVRR